VNEDKYLYDERLLSGISYMNKSASLIPIRGVQQSAKGVYTSIKDQNPKYINELKWYNSAIKVLKVPFVV
jgi:hypothetical protein